jgi:TolB-like protein/Flp pilus assembly protein TadD/tRNA A-37 threonylcarbamoyl transferase component Bud32
VTEPSQRLQAALADRYRLDREIGRGGMATVYLAADLKHRRPVAVKILHPHLAANVGPERFQREVEIAARLNHPHILTLIDSGEADGFLYYVMPFVPGESLRGRLVRERQLPVEEALRIARDVAGALGYAHGQGVVHRDIKPENVMLHEGEAMVTDFGIAKALSAAEGEHLTQTGTSVGTPAYMSPEQASGDQELDGRSDIYSLGCMLYEMLAGEPPFTGPTIQAVIVKRFTEPVPSVRATRPAVPLAVEQLLNQALARSPLGRFATAAEMARALAHQSGVATPPGAMTVATAARSAAKSIGVLPFADMSPQKDQDYFCEGIAEEIINALAKIQALRVASRSSAFAFKGKNQDIRQVGEQLNVSTVLEGSVRKAGERIRITVQLINVADGYHLWSERYDRDLEDVFAVQDEIAENIVRALRVVLTEDEKRAIEKPRTGNLQAYEYYLRGRQFFHQFREKGHQFARRMFARAIEIDPNYVLAYAGTADCSSFLYTWWDPSEANLEQADTASRKALELDPNLAEAHASRGLALTLSKRYDEAEKEFETAIKLDPQLFEAYYFYGRSCFQRGLFDGAAKWFELAASVRPEDFQTPSLLAQAYDALGRKAESDAARHRAVRIIEQHLDLNPDDARALYLGAIDLCMLGEPGRSRDWADRALSVDPEDPAVLYNVACAYARLGLADLALDCLEKATLNGAGHRAWIENDPDLNSLRAHPRFQEMLSRI